MWDLPGPGLEPVSPALTGGFLTTVPPGKPSAVVVFLTIFTQLILIFLGLEVGAQQWFSRRRMSQTEIFGRTSKKNGVLEGKGQKLTRLLWLLGVI